MKELRFLTAIAVSLALGTVLFLQNPDVMAGRYAPVGMASAERFAPGSYERGDAAEAHLAAHAAPVVQLAQN